jgi:hypothetical protein
LVGRTLQGRTAQILQISATRPAFLAKAVKIGFRLQIGMPRAGEEFYEVGTQHMDIVITPGAANDASVEHAVGRQADHLDRQVNDDPSSAEREAVRIEGQR